MLVKVKLFFLQKLRSAQCKVHFTIVIYTTINCPVEKHKHDIGTLTLLTN